MAESFPPFGENVVDADGNPIVTWDLVNNLRIEYASDGTTTSRAFTPEELLKAPSVIASRAAQDKRVADRALVRAIINDVKVEIDRVQTVLDDPNVTANERALARSAKRMGGAIIDLAKFVKDMS